MTDAFDIEAYLEQKIAQASSSEAQPEKTAEKKDERDKDKEDRRDRDKDRDRDRGRDRRRDSRDRSRDRERDRDRRRDSRDRDRDRDRDRRRRRSSSRSRSRDRRRRSASRDRRATPAKEREPTVSAEESTLSKEELEKKREIENLTKDQRTIFVSQLTKKVGEADLERFFGQISKVRSIIMVRDKHSGHHKGFAYVEMDDLECIPNCLLFNNVVPDFQKFPILVKASEAEKNFLAKKETANVKTEVVGPDTRIYVGNIHIGLDENALRAALEQFGTVESVKLQRDNLGNSKGYAFVKYAKAESANLAMATLPRVELMGRLLRVGAVTEGRTISDTPAAPSSFAPSSDSNANWRLDADDGNSGLSLNAQGRMMLMAKLGQAAGLQMPAPPAVTATAAAMMTPPPIVGPPTQALLIKNMFDPATETEPHWDEDIREDVSEECGKFGVVVSCYVEKHKPGGLVLIKLQSVESATKAAQALHGRFFAGRMVIVEFINEATFSQMTR